MQQAGTIEGTVSPPVAGVRITALQNGRIISSADAGAQDGRFGIVLPPGIYDLSISVPNAPFPLHFQGIRLEPGKTIDLSRIEIPSPSPGKAVLSGRVFPTVAGTMVSISGEGRETAWVNADHEGNYVFKELPAGSYTLLTRAPDYASDTVAMSISHEETATQNIRLLYASAIEGVDWAAGKVRVTGVGMPPADATNMTIRREMARRAALADAQRKLMKAVAEVKAGPDLSMKSLMGEKNFSRKIQGFIKGYRIVAERELDGGKIEIDLELPLTGQSGLSRYLSE